MIVTAFITCALALHPIFVMNDKDRDAINQIKKIRKFIIERNPDVEIVVVPEKGPPLDIGWEIYPLTWKGQNIYIKRPVVSDKRRIRRN